MNEHPRTKHRAPEELRALENRLTRIEGQVRGIRRMLDENAYCTDIVTQVAAARAALGAFSREILKRHIETCVVEDIRKGDNVVVNDLVDTLMKLIQ